MGFDKPVVVMKPIGQMCATHYRLCVWCSHPPNLARCWAQASSNLQVELVHGILHQSRPVHTLRHLDGVDSDQPETTSDNDRGMMTHTHLLPQLTLSTPSHTHTLSNLSSSVGAVPGPCCNSHILLDTTTTIMSYLMPVDSCPRFPCHCRCSGSRAHAVASRPYSQACCVPLGATTRLVQLAISSKSC